MKIIVDQDICIGAASCVAIAAKTFGLNTEGKVFILNESKEEVTRADNGGVVVTATTHAMDARETIIEAAKSCPVLAITLFEDSGEEIIL